MQKKWSIFWHVVFWVSAIALLMFIGRNNSQISIEKLLILFGVFGLINITLFYINFLVFIPRFLHQKKYGHYAISILFLIPVFAFIKYGLALHFHDNVLLRGPSKTEIGFTGYFLSAVFTGLIFVFLSIVLQFTMDWFRNDRIRRELENQKLSSELAFLKSQINPHFLFNSLNSIYSLAYQRSENTPEAILKLSEIMRYMLYECNDHKVDLGKELQYLQNYIDLQIVRFGRRAHVDFEINGILGHQQIVPMILISFVENGFKHGIANDPEHPIRLKIDVTDQRLEFFMSNKKHLSNKDETSGIGLANVKRRLDLLYKGKYQLKIRNESDHYTCKLILDL